jgi:putative endonuclease
LILIEKNLSSAMVYFAYVLLSLKDGIHYYGSSSNLSSRLKSHNAGKSKFTKGHRPWELIYSEEFETRSEAMKRELFFKSIDGSIWLKENGII